jgi:hypothetical protein
MFDAGLERPDIVIFSRSTKTVILIENTCPDELGVQKASIRKTKRYGEPQNRNGHVQASLVSRLVATGWTTHAFNVEVCARCHVATSVRRCMKALGFSNKEYKALQCTLETTAVHCLTVIWNSRNNPVWCPARPAVWPVGEMPPLERVPHRPRALAEENLLARERSNASFAAIPPPLPAKAAEKPADDLPPGIVQRQNPAVTVKEEPDVDQNADFEAQFADELELDVSF